MYEVTYVRVLQVASLLAQALGATSFHVAVQKCSLGPESHAFCEHIRTARQRLDELLLGEGTLITLVPSVWSMSCLYWLGAQVGRCSCELGSLRAASNLLETSADPVQGGKHGWRRGDAVDEQLKLRATRAAIWQTNTPCQCSSGRRMTGDTQAPQFFPHSEGLIDLIVLIEAKCEGPTLCNWIVSTSQAAGGVRRIGLHFAIVRVQCKLRRIEVNLWEASNGECFFWPRTREVSSDASGSRRHGVSGPQQTGTRWPPSSMICAKPSIMLRIRN